MNPVTDSAARFMDACRQRVEVALKGCLPNPQQSSGQLSEAMSYAVLGAGKRIRPILCYAAAQVAGEVTSDTDRAACAVELIHAYSLIHDDLPAMDDDNLRRGKPACHIAFGEATAILAGDALQTLAFEQLTAMTDVSADVALALVKTLAQAAGARGMVDGQAIDIAAANTELTLQQLEHMHRRKTGDMIAASVKMGAMTTHCEPSVLVALRVYADALGLAFQIKDDILDIESATAVIGKPQGADQRLNKPTYGALLGIVGARQKLQQLHAESLAALTALDGRADPLRQLVSYVVDRDH